MRFPDASKEVRGPTEELIGARRLLFRHLQLSCLEGAMHAGLDLSPSGFIVSQTDIPFFHSERTEESHQHESS